MYCHAWKTPTNIITVKEMSIGQEPLLTILATTSKYYVKKESKTAWMEMDIFPLIYTTLPTKIS